MKFRSLLACSAAAFAAASFVPMAVAAEAKPANASNPQAVTASYIVDPTKVEGTVDVRIYGQFLEHIFNSVHGGLWGDMLLNPRLQGSSFTWRVKDGEVVQSRAGYFNYLPFGDSSWTDYEFTFEAYPEGGDGNVDILDVGPFRYTDDQHFYHVRIGAKGKTLNLVERNGERGSKLHSAPFAGNVPEKQWNKVRLRVEKDHIQIWVNGEQIIDFTDDKDPARPPLLSGMAGLNITSMPTRFRNIRVTSLDGRVLHDGPPSARDLSIRPRHWELVGRKGSASRPENAMKGGQEEVVIACTEGGAEFGIQQRHMAVEKGMGYRGALTARSDSPVKLLARLVDEKGATIAEQPVAGAASTLEKLEFTLRPDRTTADAALQVLVAGKGEVSVGWVSLFPQSAVDCGGFRPDLLAAIKAQQPATIRYPGGCFASHYRWKDGIGPRESRRYFPREIWEDVDPSQLGTDEFIDLCRRVGAEPIIAINAGEGNPSHADEYIQEMLDWMEYCNGGPETKWGKVRAANGHPEPYNVRYWEIDNETWGWKVDPYIETVKRFSRAIRKHYPNVAILACGGYGYDDGGGSSKGWNQRLIDEAANDFDFLSIHYYNGCPMETYPWNHVTDPRRYEAYIRDELGTMISRSSNQKMRVYVSEWGQMREDWPSGPYTGGILNGFERISELASMTCPAVWLQTAPPRWWSSSILFDNHRMYTTPQYLVGKLWRDHFAPSRVKLDGPELPLNVVATATADGAKAFLKLVNPEDKAVETTVRLADSFPVKSASMKMLAAGLKARNSLDRPDAIKVVDGTVQSEEQTLRFTMPPHSVGVVTVER